MIHYLFPQAVYSDKNTEILDSCRKLFEIAAPHLSITDENFGTTLVEYAPIKSLVSIGLTDKPECRPLLNYITKSVVSYMKENCISMNYNIVVTNLWLNEMDRRGRHLPHTHYGYTYSGVFYVDVPKGAEKIQFYDFLYGNNFQSISRVTKWIPSNSNIWFLEVEPGSILLFPANLKHGVKQTEFEGIRRSIAFDVVLVPTKTES